MKADGLALLVAAFGFGIAALAVALVALWPVLERFGELVP